MDQQSDEFEVRSQQKLKKGSRFVRVRRKQKFADILRNSNLGSPESTFASGLGAGSEHTGVVH